MSETFFHDYGPDPSRAQLIAARLADVMRDREAVIVVIVAEDPADADYAVADACLAVAPGPGGIADTPSPADVVRALRLTAASMAKDYDLTAAGTRPRPAPPIPPAFGGRPIGRDL